MGSVAWSPTNLGSTLTAWYKADSISGSDGASVSAWSDSSGNGHNTAQATSARQPSLQTSELNSQSVVRFDGTNDILSDSDIAALDVGTGDIWMAAVFKSTDDSGVQFMFEKGTTTFALMTTAAGVLQARLGGTSNIPLQSAGNWSRTAFVLATASRVSSTCNGFVNGTAMTTTGTTNSGSISNSNVFDIGATAVGGNPMTGDIAEILVGGATLSSADRLKIEGYLAHKYGLEGNLPSDHTYKSAAPTVTVLGLGGAGSTVLDIFVDTGATRKIGTIEGSFDASVDTFTKYLDFLEPAEVVDLKLGLRTSKKFHGDLQLCEIKSIFTDTWVVTYNKTHVGGIHTSLERAVGEVAGTIANRGGWILNDIIPRDGYVDPDS